MLRAFCFPIRQDRLRDDPVKTEYDESQGIALAASDEEAVDTSILGHMQMATKHSATFLWDHPVSGSAKKAGRTETSRRAKSEIKNCRSKWSRGTRFPLAELRGNTYSGNLF